MHRIVPLLVALALAGCASIHNSRPSRDLVGSDDKAAAESVLDLLGEAGVPAELSSDGLSVFVYRRGMATLLTPIVQADGMDRVVATRRYAPAAGHTDEDLGDLAQRLNDALNVGVFSVDAGALVFQSQMTFLDQLDSEELVAFLGWLDAAELAVERVDGPEGVLLISNKG
jgi:hypothetical protein